MTSQEQVSKDTNYITILDHGFVGVVQREITLPDGTTHLIPDIMGSDEAVVAAARVSYGKGTKGVSQDRDLLRYLMRHEHTSPFEMSQVKFHIKIPIFIMRQLVRHRTASLNEYSGRYSEMTDEFYVPSFEHLQPQSSNNKQGRSGEINDHNKSVITNALNYVYNTAFETYEKLLAKDATQDGEENAFGNFDNDYQGLTRELSRIVLPVSNYTELYWTIDLKNLFHFLRLRLDSHAQYEIRVLAQAMYDHTKKLFPLQCEAFEDYMQHARRASRMDRELIADVLNSEVNPGETVWNLVKEVAGGKEAIMKKYGMSSREFDEFENNFATLLRYPKSRED